MFDDPKHPIFDLQSPAPDSSGPEVTLRSIEDPKTIRRHRHDIGDALDCIRNFSELLQSGYRLDRPEASTLLTQFATAVQKISTENELMTRIYREVITHLESRNSTKPKEGNLS